MKKRTSAILAALILSATVVFSGCGRPAEVTDDATVSTPSRVGLVESQPASSVSDGKIPVISSGDKDYSYQLTDGGADISYGAILHCWSWSFKTIEENLPAIKEAGYTSIQTSPINECKDGDDGGMELFGDGKWYYHYQPTDYKIGNYQLGTEDEFKQMCSKATSHRRMLERSNK